jgi:anti-anti-sigma factor
MQINIDIKWGRKDRILIAMLEGRVDSRNADVFEHLLDLGIDSGDEALILDLEHVTFFSSAGLRVGLRMAKKFSQPGKKFAICALSKSVRDIVKISGFDKIITIYDTQASAVEGLENG